MLLCTQRLGKEDEQIRERLWQRVVARCTRRDGDFLVMELGEGDNVLMMDMFILFLGGEARRAKVQEVMYYRETLGLEVGPWLPVGEDKLGGFFPKKNLDDSTVGDRIKNYMSWIERVQKVIEEEMERVREVRGYPGPYT